MMLRAPKDFYFGRPVPLDVALHTGSRENFSKGFKRRMEVYAKDGFKCVSCGLRGTHVMVWNDSKNRGARHNDMAAEVGRVWVMFTIDHIIPKSKGGANQPGNLACMCGPCNWKKKDTLDTSLGGVYKQSIKQRDTVTGIVGAPEAHSDGLG